MKFLFLMYFHDLQMEVSLVAGRKGFIGEKLNSPLLVLDF